MFLTKAETVCKQVCWPISNQKAQAADDATCGAKLNVLVQQLTTDSRIPITRLKCISLRRGTAFRKEQEGTQFVLHVNRDNKVLVMFPCQVVRIQGEILLRRSRLNTRHSSVCVQQPNMDVANTVALEMCVVLVNSLGHRCLYTLTLALPPLPRLCFTQNQKLQKEKGR